MPTKASKLLEAMRQSKAKWKRKDLVSLYSGYGFVIITKGKHDMVTHPEFPQLVTFLPRRNKIPQYLVATAVQMVDRLNALKSMGEEDAGEQD